MYSPAITDFTFMIKVCKQNYICSLSQFSICQPSKKIGSTVSKMLNLHYFREWQSVFSVEGITS